MNQPTIATDNLSRLKEEGRKEFDQLFVESRTHTGTERFVREYAEKLESFQDHLIEKAFTAGKEEAFKEAEVIAINEGLPASNEMMKVVRAIRAARTTKPTP